MTSDLPARWVRLVRRWSILALLALLLPSCGRSPANELLLQIEGQRGGESAPLFLGPLSTWGRTFGVPATIPQADGGTTFFYWPDSGIGAFAHPLYEAQHRRREQPDYTITSVVVPLRKTVRPIVAPAGETRFISFTRLMLLDVGGRPAGSLTASDWAGFGAEIVPPPGSRAGKRRARAAIGPSVLLQVHLSEGGEPELLEIRENSLFSRYD